LEQTDHYFARLYKLPSGAVTAVMPSKMRFLTSGILIADTEMTTAVASQGGAVAINVEVKCSDAMEYRRRAETRVTGISGFTLPS